MWVWLSKVDDDDRDFRRSRRHDTDMSGGGGSGGGVTRKITAPIGVGGAGRLGLGKKRGLNSLPDMAGVISSRSVALSRSCWGN